MKDKKTPDDGHVETINQHFVASSWSLSYITLLSVYILSENAY
jgi:hypothetical protein